MDVLHDMASRNSIALNFESQGDYSERYQSVSDESSIAGVIRVPLGMALRSESKPAEVVLDYNAKHILVCGQEIRAENLRLP